MRHSATKITSIVFCAAHGQKIQNACWGYPKPRNDRTAVKKIGLRRNRYKGDNIMENVKRKMGRPPKQRVMEFEGMTYEGAINNALDKEVKSELDNSLADKDESQLTDDERKYLKRKKEKKSYTLNVRFTESEMQDIIEKCEQYGYKNKTEYIRDCVRARVDLTPDNSEISETNRLMKRIGSNINQILIRLHSTGHIYAEDIDEIKRGVNEIWHTLLSIRSGQRSAQQSLTSLTEIRPSTAYMSSLMLAGKTAEVLPRTSKPSDSEEQDGHKSLHTT